MGGDAGVLDRVRAGFIRRHGLQLAGSFLAGRLRAGTLLRRVRARKSILETNAAPYQLRFIAIAPHACGKGFGTDLLAAFEQTLPFGSAYHAWTLDGPFGAEQFYVKNGFIREASVNGHLRMWKRISSARYGGERCITLRR